MRVMEGWMLAPGIVFCMVILVTLLRLWDNYLIRQRVAKDDELTRKYLNWITEMKELDLSLEDIYTECRPSADGESTSKEQKVPGRVEAMPPLSGGREGTDQ